MTNCDYMILNQYGIYFNNHIPSILLLSNTSILYLILRSYLTHINIKVTIAVNVQVKGHLAMRLDITE